MPILSPEALSHSLPLPASQSSIRFLSCTRETDAGLYLLFCLIPFSLFLSIRHPLSLLQEREGEGCWFQSPPILFHILLLSSSHSAIPFLSCKRGRGMLVSISSYSLSLSSSPSTQSAILFLPIQGERGARDAGFYLLLLSFNSFLSLPLNLASPFFPSREM